MRHCTLIDEPTMVRVRVAELGDGQTVWNVERSPLVEDDDPWLAGVREALANGCVEHLHKSSSEDDRWMFGTRVEHLFRLFAECPGDTTVHECVFAEVTNQEVA
jgi:hypothetical protein